MMQKSKCTLISTGRCKCAPCVAMIADIRANSRPVPESVRAEMRADDLDDLRRERRMYGINE